MRADMKRWIWTLVLLVSVGCGGGGSNSVGNSETENRGTIGVSLLTLTNPFFQVIGDNITAEAKKHGYDVTILSADEAIAKQDAQVKDFIVNGVSAIVLSPCQVEAIGPTIREANKAGIPVFTVDIPCRLDDVEIVSQIASDNYGGGQQAADGMIEALGEAGGQVAVLHFEQAESCQLRVNGFTDRINEHNKTSSAPVEIVAVLEGGGAKDRGATATEALLQSWPGLDGIFAINDPSALGALAALETAGKANDVVIIGFDGQPDGKRAIREGKIYGDPVQYPDRMGVEVVKAIVAYSKGEDVPSENLIPTSFYRQADAMDDPELE